MYLLTSSEERPGMHRTASPLQQRTLSWNVISARDEKTHSILIVFSLNCPVKLWFPCGQDSDSSTLDVQRLKKGLPDNNNNPVTFGGKMG